MTFAQRLFGAASTLALAALVAGEAFAQDAPAAPASEDAAVEEVVITGSRIVRRDYVAESAVVTADQSLVKNSGTVSLDASLAQLPQFTGTTGSQTPSTTASAGRSGRANLNLRGLGISRTLVLLDGRRLPPADAQGAVDLNTIPNSLLESIEVITGGASATYGSDAIAGVVNLKLRRNFEGLIVDAQYGQTSRGDGKNEQISIAFGGDFADGRGHAMGALEYFNRDLISRDPNERSFFDNETSVSFIQGFVGTGNLPTQASVNTVFAKYGISPAPSNSSTFFIGTDNQLYTQAIPPFNLGNRSVGPFPIIPVYSAFGTIQSYGLRQGERTTLQPSQTRYNAFARFDYDLTEQVNVYAQFLYTNYDTYIQAAGVAPSTQNVFMSPNNPFIPADMKALLNSRPRPQESFLISSGNFGLISPFENFNETNAGQGLVGASAKDFFKDWTADIYAAYGKVKSDDLRKGYVDLNAINAVLGAADGGASLCAGGVDVFRYVEPSQACKDFLLRDLTREATFEQQVVEANLQGGLFELPAGELRFALGATYRSEAYENNPSNEYIFSTVAGVRPTLPAEGEYDVKEIYGELLVPVLADLPMIKALNLNLGYRYADYSSIGGASSYKVSGEWRVVDSLMFRAGYQKSIRAPSVGDLYAGLESSQATIGTPATGGGDPCDNRHPARTSGNNATQLRALCLSQGISAALYPTFQNFVNTQPTRISGNPDLDEEKSESITAGVVWRSKFDSPWLSNLQVSVDYYDIKLDGAIGVISANVTIPRCFNLDGVSNPTYDPNNFYCSLLVRATSNQVFEYVKSPTVNLAGYKTWGVDFQLDWKLNLGDVGLDDKWGQVAFNTVVSYTGEYAIQNSELEPFFDFKGTIGNTQIDEASSHPEWKAITSATWTVGPLSTTFRWRFIGHMGNALLVTAPNTVTRGVKATDYYDLNATYKLGEKWELRAGVINLLDKFPPVWTTKGTTDPFNYDLIGRRFFLGVRARF